MLDEVFNLADRNSADALIRETNFFNFLARHAGKGDPEVLMPNNHDQLFVDFLEYLRGFSPKPLLFVDVKYNTTHFFTKPWAERLAPYLFELLVQHNVKVLNIKRKHYLRYVLSSEKAWHSGRYTVYEGEHDYSDSRRVIDVPFLLAELSHCAEEDAIIDRQFAAYEDFRAYDYSTLFPGDRVIEESFLEDIAEWFGIENALPARLDLSEAVVTSFVGDNRELRGGRSSPSRDEVRVLPARRAGVSPVDSTRIGQPRHL